MRPTTRPSTGSRCRCCRRRWRPPWPSDDVLHGQCIRVCGRTPLYVAALNAHEDAVSALLQLGAQPVHFEVSAAVLGESASVVRLLLETKASFPSGTEVPVGLSRKNLQPLMLAARRGNIYLPVLRELLQAGASVNLVDAQHRHSLMHAVKSAGVDVVRALLAAKADPAAQRLRGSRGADAPPPHTGASKWRRS
jgi:ankyrin repeat protein